MEKKNLVLSGFGKGNGKVVHVIVGSIDGNITLCEAKQMEPEPDKELKDVTCKKCQRLKFYKTFFGDKEEAKTFGELVKENLIEEPQEEVQKIAESAKTTEIEKPKELPKDINTYQFIKEKNNSNKYNIKHQRSGKAFFEAVEEKAIDLCLKKLNALETTWNGQGTPGTKYFSIVREAFKLGCMECGIQYPKCLDDEKSDEENLEEKPKITKPKKPKNYILPRRKTEKTETETEKKLKESFGVKDEPTKIKRRKPKEVKLRRRDKNIFRNSSPKQTIINLMENKISKNDILKAVIEKHKIRSETLSILFSTTIRQAVRIKGKRIAVTYQGKDAKGGEDIYKILE